MRGVPTRLLPGAVRLQLVQLTGLAQPGFICRAGKERVSVWYWDEARSLPGLEPSRYKTGLALWPESVMSAVPPDGLHLIKRSEGYEALAVVVGEIRRTRWYAQLPDVEKWTLFARDAGHATEGIEVPVPRSAVSSELPPKGWKLQSRFLAPIPLPVWGIAALSAFLGAVLLAAAVYQLKLTLAIREERAALAVITEENAAALALQEKIRSGMSYLEKFHRVQPETLQLDIMRALADSGLIDMEGKLSLLEWECRGSQLRLLFAVQPGLALGDFLAQLERLPMVRELRLQPDTPPQTVGVQAVLKPWRWVAAEEENTEPMPDAEAVPVPEEAAPQTQPGVTP